MGDVFIRKARQRRDFKFVYKRKIFLHSHPWPSQDPAFNRLVYLQVRASTSSAVGPQVTWRRVFRLGRPEPDCTFRPTLFVCLVLRRFVCGHIV